MNVMPVPSTKQSPNAKKNGLKNARALSAAQGAVNKLNKLLPALIADPRRDGLNDLTDELSQVATSVVINEVAKMSPREIINGAGSIGYYARKFNIK